jgi:GT2 family glycosyltransferase
MYLERDISVVIPTYNRPDDLKQTLDVLLKRSKILNEIVIVDQSIDDRTKKLIDSFKNKKLKYVFSKIPSITIARNVGVKNSSKRSKLIFFIDDDVSVSDNFFKEVLKVFNEHKEAKGVAAQYVVNNIKTTNFIEDFAKKIFFLSFPEKNRARMVSAYGNTYPAVLTKVINVEWFPGVNMAYKREIFSEQHFDENLLGYTLAEDIDFSYRLFKRYPSGVFMTPFAKLLHRESTVERYPTEKMSFINQIDHFYFYFKNLNHGFFDKIKFLWALFGIFILRTAKLVFQPDKISYLKLKYFVASLFYCFTHISDIKRGHLRLFMKK